MLVELMNNGPPAAAAVQVAACPTGEDGGGEGTVKMQRMSMRRGIAVMGQRVCLQGAISAVMHTVTVSAPQAVSGRHSGNTPPPQLPLLALAYPGLPCS